MLAGGTGLVRDQPAAVAMWAVLYLAVTGASLMLARPMIADMMAWQQAAMIAEVRDAMPPVPPLRFLGAVMLMQLVGLVVLVAIFAAAVRAVAHGGRDGWAFLRLGMDEVRLIGLALLLGILSFAATIVGVIALIIVGIVLNLLAGPSALLVILPLYLILIAAYLWAGMRLSLAGAYTVLRGRIVVREAWDATRGRFWSLFGAYLVIMLGFVVASLLALAITNPAMLSLYGGMEPHDMAAALAAQQAMIAELFGPRMMALMVVGSAINALLLAVLFGAIASAAIGAGPERPKAA